VQAAQTDHCDCYGVVGTEAPLDGISASGQR
jgi:hypothetical protein